MAKNVVKKKNETNQLSLFMKIEISLTHRLSDSSEIMFLCVCVCVLPLLKTLESKCFILTVQEFGGWNNFILSGVLICSDEILKNISYSRDKDEEGDCLLGCVNYKKKKNLY